MALDTWLAIDPTTQQPIGAVNKPFGKQPTQQDMNKLAGQQVPAQNPYAAQLAGFKTYQETPEYQSILQDYDQNRQAALQQQQEGVAQYEDLLNQHLAKTQNDPKLDLSPLMAFADSMYGTNLAQNYKGPQNPKAALETTAALQQGLQKAKGALTNEEQQYLLSRAGLMQKADQTRLDALNAAGKLQNQGDTGEANKDFKNTKETVRIKENFHKEFGKPIEAMGDFLAHVSDVKNLIKKNGGVPDVKSPDYQKYKSAVDNMIVRYNSDVAKLGALAGADLVLLSGATGTSPEFMKTWFNEKLQGGVGGTLEVLDSLESLVDRKVDDIEGTSKDIYMGVTDDQYANARKKYFAKKAGNFKSAAPSYDPDVLEYSKAHGITPDQALTIKKQRGG